MNKSNSAALYALISGVIWSFTGLLCKLVSWNSFTLMGARSLVALAVLGIGRGSFRIRPSKGLWITGAGISLTSLLYMTALRLTCAANAIVLQYTSSVFVILYMLLVKKQRPLKSEAAAAAFVILGVCLCFAGGLAAGQLTGNLIALLSGVTFAMVFISTRYSGCDPLDGVYFGTLLSCPFAVFTFFDSAFSPTPVQLLILLAMGCGLGLGYLFFSLGMRQGISAVKACIISNVEPVLNPIWIFVFMGEKPGALNIVGAAVVLLAITLQSLYENQKSKRAA